MLIKVRAFLRVPSEKGLESIKFEAFANLVLLVKLIEI